MNYKYPHSYASNWVEQSYLPKELEFRPYKPQLNGSEKVMVENFQLLTKKR